MAHLGMRGSRFIKPILINNIEVTQMSMDLSFCRKTAPQPKSARKANKSSLGCLATLAFWRKRGCANGAVNRAAMGHRA